MFAVVFLFISCLGCSQKDEFVSNANNDTINLKNEGKTDKAILYKFKLRKWEQVKVPKNIRGFNEFIVDKNGVLWLIKDNKIVSVNNGKSKSFNSGTVKKIDTNSKGELYALKETKNAGGKIIKLSESGKFTSLPGNGFSNFLIDSKDNLWGVKNKGKKKNVVFNFNGKVWKSYKMTDVVDLIADKNGSIIVKKKSKNITKIFKFNNGKWDIISPKNLNSIALDSKNMIWGLKDGANKKGVLTKIEDKDLKTFDGVNYSNLVISNEDEIILEKNSRSSILLQNTIVPLKNSPKINKLITGKDGVIYALRNK